MSTTPTYAPSDLIYPEGTANLKHPPIPAFRVPPTSLEDVIERLLFVLDSPTRWTKKAYGRGKGRDYGYSTLLSYGHREDDTTYIPYDHKLRPEKVCLIGGLAIVDGDEFLHEAGLILVNLGISTLFKQATDHARKPKHPDKSECNGHEGWQVTPDDYLSSYPTARLRTTDDWPALVERAAGKTKNSIPRFNDCFFTTWPDVRRVLDWAHDYIRSGNRLPHVPPETGKCADCGESGLIGQQHYHTSERETYPVIPMSADEAAQPAEREV